MSKKHKRPRDHSQFPAPQPGAATANTPAAPGAQGSQNDLEAQQQRLEILKAEHEIQKLRLEQEKLEGDIESARRARSWWRTAIWSVPIARQVSPRPRS